MSWEKYGPPEREAQGRGVMKKRAGRGADGRRMENTKCEGGRMEGGGGRIEEWVGSREEKRGGRGRVIEREREERWRRMEYGGEWRN